MSRAHAAGPGAGAAPGLEVAGLLDQAWVQVVEGWREDRIAEFLALDPASYAQMCLIKAREISLTGAAGPMLLGLRLVPRADLAPGEIVVY